MGTQTDTTTGNPGTGASIFRRIDWYAFWTATIVSMIVYVWTIAPTVTLEDSGELATASAFLGVPHPPGYPIWTIFTWIFTKLFAFMTFRGQPNPAFGVGLTSAVFGALASGLTSILICRSGADMLKGMTKGTKLDKTVQDWICFAGGVSGSLIFAFSSVNWSQAVIAEVYSLNAFFLALVLFLTYVWMRRPQEKLTWITGMVAGIGLTCFGAMVALVGWHMTHYGDFMEVGIHYVMGMLLLALLFAALAVAWKRNPQDRLLYLIAFAFGMGLTNYQVLLLLMASLVIVIFVKDLTLFRDFLIAGLPFLGTYLLSQKGFVTAATVAKLPKEIPHTFGSGYVLAIVYTLAAGAALMIMLQTQRGRLKLLKQYIAISIPYAVLGFLLWRHSLAPSTIQGIDSVLPGITHPTAAGTYIYAILNCAALALVYRFLPHGRTVAPSILGLELGLAFYVFMPLASETNPPMNWAFPRTWEGFKHAITRGQYERLAPTDMFSKRFLNQVGDYLRDLRVTFTLPLALLGFLPFTAWRIKAGGARFRAMYVSGAMAAVAVALIAVEEFVAPATGEIFLISIAYRSIIAGIMLLMIVGGAIMIFSEVWDFLVRLFSDQPAVAYERHEDDFVSTDVDGISRKWTVVTLSGFLVMSLILIMLASPKGDMQDAFIQRVKFISSHALFAIWIGYGIVFMLATAGAFARGRKTIMLPAIAIAALLWIEPIRQNAYNKELIRTYGGVEQNNHDYGWQFGNYQLRGADAVTEELDPEEEPLPNPTFPPEMTPDAIFFGGTDPGRFVPTYMIYGARVREDVYLITQNALADNTYMNVMRDLYGDQIWIPAQKDSARAFARYVEEVNSGKRPRNAQLKIENGRVQVSGALGVMEINGILAQMIFERNNFRHDFYVEESYVIQWMYPYLTPHGLIMKINRERTPLQPDVTRRDLDFWDWYVRRLDRSDRFARDVVARKSFSKLRSAIGGLYRSRGRLGEAETAFQQARILYPLSPEANFRLVQEVLIPQRRFEESETIMETFGEQDPGNTKVPDFLNQLKRLQGLYERLEVLEKEMRGGALDANKALELAAVYQQVGRISEFNAVASGILRNTNLPAVYAFRVAQLHDKARQHPQMEKALDQALVQMPDKAPADILLEIAKLYAKLKKPEKMLHAMEVYVRSKPDDWRGWLDVAAMYIGFRREADAVKALEQAIRYGGREAMNLIESDGRFKPFRQRLMGGPNTSLMGLPQSRPGLPLRP